MDLLRQNAQIYGMFTVETMPVDANSLEVTIKG